MSTDRPLPKPLAADGVVTIDAATRTLVVKPAPSARPYAKVLWDEGRQAQIQAMGRRHDDTPTVWANGAGRSQITYGTPGDNGTLRFRFHPAEQVYEDLVSTPGLAATIVVDRATSTIMTVTFRARG